MISAFSPDKPYTVYCSECYWSDRWDPLSYGRPINLSKPFFEQFDELLHDVPVLGNVVGNSVNCDTPISVWIRKTVISRPVSEPVKM